MVAPLNNGANSSGSQGMWRDFSIIVPSVKSKSKKDEERRTKDKGFQLPTTAATTYRHQSSQVLSATVHLANTMIGNHPTQSSSPNADRNFNDLKDIFKDRIYGTLKGTYRFEMATQDLDAELERRYPNKTSLVALDIGGGLGQMTLNIGKRSNFDKVVYYDIAEQMKEHVDLEVKLKQGSDGGELKAKVETHVGGLKDAVRAIFQDEPRNALPDVVCLHAVLEWLQSPMEDLDLLLHSMQPGSILSLLYYNNIASEKPKKPRKKPRKPSKLTPYHEFHYEEIERKLIESGFEITCRTGLRIKKFQRDGTDVELKQYLEEERKIARIEPFCRQGRYNHIIAVKAKDKTHNDEIDN